MWFHIINTNLVIILTLNTLYDGQEPLLTIVVPSAIARRQKRPTLWSVLWSICLNLSLKLCSSPQNPKFREDFLKSMKSSKQLLSVKQKDQDCSEFYNVEGYLATLAIMISRHSPGLLERAVTAHISNQLKTSQNLFLHCKQVCRYLFLQFNLFDLTLILNVTVNIQKRSR